MHKIVSLLLLTLFLSSGASVAQVGTLDSTFLSGDGPNRQVKTIAVQPDGKILIGGGFVEYDGIDITRLARLNADGTLDNSFRIGDGPSGTVEKIELVEDGKMFVVGSISTYNGVRSDFIVKLNDDGSRDNTFNIIHNSGVSSSASDLVVLEDGSIFIAGGIRDFNSTGLDFLVKLNPDGSQNTDFDQGSGFDRSINAIDMQSNGKIIVGGNFTEYNGQAIRYLARLNINGTLDTTFNTDERGPSNKISEVKVLADDRIIVAGSIGNYNGISTNDVIKILPDGELDISFQPSVSDAEQIFVQPDGKVIVVGPYTFLNADRRSLMRYNSDGTFDSLFISGMGAGPNAKLESCALQSDGKILIGGTFSFTTYDSTRINILARINGDVQVSEVDPVAVREVLEIYPNPVDDHLHFRGAIQKGKFRIYGLGGRLMKRGVLQHGAPISVEDLESGIYHLLLDEGSRAYRGRFVVR
ncbi:MAG: T9SS type A sorting domain-containing protein [Saprospiraceae bacterium]